VADPVSLDPRPTELVVAQNRTASLTLIVTLRDPFTSFKVAWRNLPPGVTNAGQTSFTPPAAGVPVQVDLVLAAATLAGPGGPVSAVFSPVGSPAVETRLRLDLVVTQPLPDLAVAPLGLDQPFPWPGNVVNVTTSVTNIGFEDAPGARVVAGVEFNGTNATELLNYTLATLSPQDSAPVSFNWTGQTGTQRVFVRVEPEPTYAELTTANNEREAVVDIARFGLAVEGPAGVVEAAPPGNSTTVLLTVSNRGTRADNYTVGTVVVANPSTWGVALPVPDIRLAARTNTTVAVTVTTPSSPLGGEVLVLDVRVSSQGLPGLDEVVRLTVLFPQVHAGAIQATPDDLELPYRGNATVAVAIRNDGNGRERYSILLQNGDPHLGVSATASSFDLGPGEPSSFELTLQDLGLVSAERPYAIEVVAVSTATGDRLTAIISVRVEPISGVAVSPIEPNLEVDPAANSTFHVNVTNTGNTNAVVTLSVVPDWASMEAHLEAEGLLLAPRATVVINGSLRFLEAPLAGEYLLTLRAVETRGGVEATMNMTVRVPVFHRFEASVATAPDGIPTPLVFHRTVTVANLGNVDESLQIVIGFVPVGHTVTIVPLAASVLVPAFGNTSFQVQVERTAAAPTDGEVSIVLSSGAGRDSVTVEVPYAFPAAQEDTTLVWGAIVGAAAVGVGAWMWVTRSSRKP
jgi:hypothetical protein